MNFASRRARLRHAARRARTRQRVFHLRLFAQFGLGQPGLRHVVRMHLSLREDYFNQSRLVQGTDRVSRGSFALPNDEEVQYKTINRNTLLGADYSFNRYWGLSVQLPWFDRHHQTFAEGDSALSTSDGQGVGDVRVVARYQGFSPDASFGLQFGLKLPTGSFKQTFSEGPETGELLDRGLQRGTGTTDALLGAYKFGYLERIGRLLRPGHGADRLERARRLPAGQFSQHESRPALSRCRPMDAADPAQPA